MVPLSFVEYPDEQAFPIEMFDIFYQAGLADDDPYTSTVRVSAFQESCRDEMRQAIRKRLASRDAERLIRLLDDHDWDVAFLIDGQE